MYALVRSALSVAPVLKLKEFESEHTIHWMQQ
jgi:hypothetical protein